MFALDKDLSKGHLKDPSQLQQRLTHASAKVLARHRIYDPGYIERMVEQVFSLAINSSARALSESLMARAPLLLEEERNFRVGFEQRLQERWGEALQLTELIRFVALEIGQTLSTRNTPQQDDFKYASLLRLHARACLITSEVLALLRSGHASGAHARWRAAHEVAVIGSFLSENNQELAHRYLLHEHVESLRAAREFQDYAEVLEYEQIPSSEFRELETTVEELTAAFGAEFRKPYGWAVPPFERAPSFRDIEQTVKMDRMRPYYRMASHPVHANSKALHFDLGIISPQKVMLAGPSNAGLADPGQGICISLLQATTFLVTQHPDAGDLAGVAALSALVTAAEYAYIDIHNQLEKEAEEENLPS